MVAVGLWAFQNCSQVDFQQVDLLSKTGIPVCRNTTAPEVKPVLKWDWYASLDKSKPSNFPDFSQVMATPVVGDLNADGRPEVVFVTWTTNSSLYFPDADGGTIPKTAYHANGVLRIVDGKTGETLMSIGDADRAPYATTTPLLIDLDGDGTLEIVYPSYVYHKVVALNHDGSLRWIYESSSYTNTAEGLSAADFNKDGKPDIVLGSEVITEDANGRPVRLFAMNGGSIYQFAYSLDSSKPQDMQIIGPAGVYDSSGNRLFSLSGVNYLAVANLDLSTSDLEIVGAGGGTVQIFSGKDGYVLKSVDLKAIGGLACPSGAIGGGPPTVGDFDGDPATTEIAVATGKYLAIFSQNGELMTKYETQDCSSLSTGVSSFDFNGDGKPEILYADEEYFRIFEIRQGQLRVVYQIPNPSGTLLEYPVVADIEGTGSSQILVASNNYAARGFYRDPGEEADGVVAQQITGLRAFEASVPGSWMPTRKIWNQYNYNPSLVTDSGQAVSSTPFAVSYTSRTFRRNSQLGKFEPVCR